MEKSIFFDIVKEDNWKLVGISSNQHTTTKETIDDLLMFLPKSKTKNTIISEKIPELNISQNNGNRNKIISGFYSGI